VSVDDGQLNVQTDLDQGKMATKYPIPICKRNKDKMHLRKNDISFIIL